MARTVENVVFYSITFLNGRFFERTVLGDCVRDVMSTACASGWSTCLQTKASVVLGRWPIWAGSEKSRA